MRNVHSIAGGLLHAPPQASGSPAPFLDLPVPTATYPTFPSARFRAQLPVTLKLGGMVTTEAKFTAGAKLLKNGQNRIGC